MIRVNKEIVFVFSLQYFLKEKKDMFSVFSCYLRFITNAILCLAALPTIYSAVD